MKGRRTIKRGNQYAFFQELGSKIEKGRKGEEKGIVGGPTAA